MASRKNQHFVPKVHLAPFASDPNGNTISLFNIKSGQLIHGAGIKHQCSRTYFYGKDGKLEEMLGQIEGRYATAVRNATTQTFNMADHDWLRLFMSAQYSRTAAAAEQIKEFYEKSAAITFRGMSLPESERPPMDPHQHVVGALRQMKAITPYMRDLDFCIVDNRTGSDFVTSDNPVINTNRFYLQKLGDDTWGAGSAGALFIMPLGPRHLACFYDPGVYAVPNRTGYVEVKKKSDVLACNEMQYLNASENIYFSDTEDGERVATELDAVRDRRVKELVRLREYVARTLPDGRERLSRLKPGMDERKFEAKYVQYSVPRSIPRHWPSILPFRLKPVSYSNGSTVGHMRKPEWLHGIKPE